MVTPTTPDSLAAGEAPETLGDYILRPKATGVDPVTGAPSLQTFPPDDLPKAEADVGVPDGSLDTLAKYATAQTLGNPAINTYSSRRADTRSGDANSYTPAVDPDLSFSEIAEFQNTGQQADATTFFDFVEPIGLMTLEWSNSGQFGLAIQDDVETSDRSWIQRQADSYGVGGLTSDPSSDSADNDPQSSGVGILLSDIIDKKSQYLPDNGRPVGTLLSNVEGWEIDVTGQNQPNPPSDYSPTKLESATDALLQMNRYNPSDGTPFITDKATGKKRSGLKKSKGWHVYQGKLGKYIAKVSREHPEISLQNLRRVALALQLRATGHYSAASQIDSNFLMDKAAWIPAFEQFAFIRVEAKHLYARLVVADAGLNVGGDDSQGKNNPYRTAGTHTNAYVPTFELPFAEITDDGDSPDFGEISQDADWEDYMTHEGNVVGYSGGSRSSFGQLNSYLEPFTGTVPIGMIMVAAAGALVLVGLSSLIELAFTGDKPASGKAGAGVVKSSRQYGVYGPHHGNWFMRMLGIPVTQNPWFRSMATGMRAFYGFGGGIPSATGAQFDWDNFIEGCLNLVQAPGFYASCLRSIVRDGEQIIQAGMDIADTTSIAGGIGNVFELIAKTMSSAPVRFLFMLAAMGDQCIMIEGAAWQRLLPATPLNRPGSSHVPEQGEMIAWYRQFDEWYPDAVNGENNNGIDTFHSKFNWKLATTTPPVVKTGKDKLTWRNEQSPGLMLLPMSFIRAQSKSTVFPNTPTPTTGSAGTENTDLNQNPGAPKISSKGRGVNENAENSQMYMKMSPKSRLSRDLVTMIENRLELEYMPFYFHDLRTNEVISFHAFMDNVSDSFSADYDSSGGFGRIDDVYIYKKTKRTINLTFWAISTGKEDFDSMWEKINKLTTLLYPQWSPGRMTSTGLQTFRMPFSQIPTASPMIRLRFGDVIKTNYSKFNLERLFGIQDAFSSGTKYNLDPARSRLTIEHTQETIRLRSRLKMQVYGLGPADGHVNEEGKIVTSTAYGIDGMPRTAGQSEADWQAQGLPAGSEIGYHAFTAEQMQKIDVERTNVTLIDKQELFLQTAYLKPAGMQGYNVGRVPVAVTANNTSTVMDKFNQVQSKDSSYYHYIWGGTPLPIYIRKKYIYFRPTEILADGTSSPAAWSYGDILAQQEDMSDPEKARKIKLASRTDLTADDRKRVEDGEEPKEAMRFADSGQVYEIQIVYECGLQPGLQEKINWGAFKAASSHFKHALSRIPGSTSTQGNIIFPFVKPIQLMPDWGALGKVQAPLEGTKFASLASSPEDLVGEQQFFNPKHNAVVRSFDSSGGRGLPGFITSMDLDYNNAPFETNTLGSKAPQWLKITMNFQPVHDIAPGIDSHGMNRAPIYNIGEHMHRTVGPLSDRDNASWDHYGHGNGDSDDMYKFYNDAASSAMKEALDKQTNAAAKNSDEG